MLNYFPGNNLCYNVYGDIMFTDTHCHVLKESYDDINDVLNKAMDNKVNRIINAAYNYDSSLEVLDLIKRFDNVYGVVGLHPENCTEVFDYNIFNNLPSKIVGIGEIGLDYHYGKDDMDKQIEIFNKQLSIAEKLSLPVVIHSRDATLDTMNILKKYNVKGVIHSFSGSYETALEYIKMGYKLGVNGVVTFKNAKLKDVYIKLSPKDIILETDSPYLTPEPYRGHKNDPSHILDIAKYMADLYGISLEELSTITNENIKEIFGI